MAKSLFQELKRRNVIKVTSGYLLLVWLILQVASIVVPALTLPDWTMTLLVVLAALGLPIVIFLSWAFELTPDGLKRDEEVIASQADSAYSISKDRKIDFIVIALLILALAYAWLKPTVDTNATAKAEPTTKQVQGSSIAVLPFVNMSNDPDQEYFTDGMSEEILNLLAKIPNLKVTSRTSAFFYKGKDIQLNKIAEQLGVANILEGSVRKAGNKLRITAQLIEAQTDTHLWSETYDRELEDIFAIQDDISNEIVNVLKSKLGIQQAQVKRDMSKVTVQAFEELAKGRNLMATRNKVELEQALIHFDNALAYAPDYVDALVSKALAIGLLSEPNYGDIPIEVAESRANKLLDRALELDKNNSDAYAVKGLVAIDRELKFTFTQKAVDLNPNNGFALSRLIYYLENLAPGERRQMLERALELEPLSSIIISRLVSILIRDGELIKAESLNERIQIVTDESFLYYRNKARIYAQSGEFANALDYALQGLDTSIDNTLLFFASRLAFVMDSMELLKPYYQQSDFEEFYYYHQNTELMIELTRQQLPRSESDIFGKYFRGMAELTAENHAEAYEYLKNLPTSFDLGLDPNYIFLLQQLGKEKEANQSIEQLQQQLEKTQTEGRDATQTAISLAMLTGDIEKAVSIVNQQISHKQLLNSHYFITPLYSPIRAHPKWPALTKQYFAHGQSEKQKFEALKNAKNLDENGKNSEPK